MNLRAADVILEWPGNLAPDVADAGLADFASIGAPLLRLGIFLRNL